VRPESNFRPVLGPRRIPTTEVHKLPVDYKQVELELTDIVSVLAGQQVQG
jgi:hypothetical protein